ncbi:HlyD family type I secretion periplasmic adaptor subunit [Novosphingobium beihaiensis]|uniref:Membrane fusion protein (MFP) family protein n=1 Tax=Novosphingobium beihaiensis TaxID=2930389 RepID=A0ABT0BW05_9SPHN|nr:HlyD family type I secretion periplasmic adaptor subunit [Novosphingobium beihaiensis]MCJ2189246.1 HlyD family type I secretion periplasmic adaptor subunit [Novosphingobium beihaiensis]
MKFADRIAARFPTLARHWDVLRVAWRRQDEADANARPRSDHEFLPAALEIMEKPPSPGLRYLLWAICGLFTLALLWSIIGKVDVIATATGKVIPTGNVKVIQPVELGTVRSIRVRNGEQVSRGQLLVELDPTMAGADEAAASANYLTSELQAARNAALLGYLGGKGVHFTAPEGTPPEVAAAQRDYVETAIAEFEGERAGLMQRKAQHEADLSSAEAEIAKLERTLPLVDQQLAAREKLTERGYFSRLKLLEYQQLRVEHIQNLEVQRANARRARAQIAEIDAQLKQLRGTFGRTALSQLVEGQDKSRVAREEVTKSSRRREYQALKAPVAGTVQQLAISTVGGVVQPAQPLMVIVPDAAQPVVEAQILNRDIGFVREGQKVRVKLEAYPFTDFGVVPGVVESISRDAIDMSQQGGQHTDASGHATQQGLVYAARIRLLQRSIDVGGKKQMIGPGLAVQAEIVIGRRRIIQYLLSPIAKTIDEAGREK